MKLSKIITLLGCALMISGCNGTNPSPDTIKPDGDVVDINDVVIDQPNNDDDEGDDENPIVEKTCKEITSGSMGGSLTDLLVGSYIEPTCTYTCSFTHNKTFSGEYKVTSDDRTIAQVSHEAGTGSFTVKGITPGDAIIQAVTVPDENTDQEAEVILQFVVHVRKTIPMEKMAKTLYDNDVFYGMFYGYKISFTEKDPLKGTLVGTDDFEDSFVNFKLIDGVKERIGNGTDFNTYKYRISVDTENSSTSRTYTYLYVSTTGDKIYMYYSNGIVDIFTTHEVKQNQW